MRHFYPEIMPDLLIRTTQLIYILSWRYTKLICKIPIKRSTRTESAEKNQLFNIFLRTCHGHLLEILQS